MTTYSMEGTVLVPVDFSADSLEAVRNALSMVSKPSDLHVLTVLAGEAHSGDSRRLQHLRGELDRALQEAVSTGAQAHVLAGDPAECICRLAAEIDAGTIVIPAHGQDATPESVIGTVTENVVRNARCRVLVVGRR